MHNNNMLLFAFVFVLGRKIGLCLSTCFCYKHVCCLLFVVLFSCSFVFVLLFKSTIFTLLCVIFRICSSSVITITETKLLEALLLQQQPIFIMTNDA
jgi:hypothetical protein